MRKSRTLMMALGFVSSLGAATVAGAADNELQIVGELAPDARAAFGREIVASLRSQRSGAPRGQKDQAVPTSPPLGAIIPFFGPRVETLEIIENGAKVTKYWESLSPEQWKNALGEPLAQAQVYDVRSGASVSFGPGSGELGKGDYKVSFVSAQARTYPCDPQNPNAGILYVGVGLKIDINARTTSAGLKIGFGAFALGANTGKISGTITAEVAGLNNSKTLSQVVGALGSKGLTFDGLIDASNAYAVANQALENMTAVSSPRIIAYKDLTVPGACLKALQAGLRTDAAWLSASSSKSAGPVAATAAEQTDTSDQQLRIVGGELVTDITQMPWIVSLYFRPGNKHWCGASIIDPNWVLTAAHCAVFTRPSSWIGAANSLNWTSPITKLEFDKVIIHPGYDPYGSDDNDVALLRIKSAVSAANPSIEEDLSDNTIGLLAKELSPRYANNNKLALVAGWGATTMGGAGSNTLRSVAVQVVSNRRCNAPQSYGYPNGNGGRITNNMMCAGFAPGGKDSCQGDSGGPLTVNGPESRLLAGVVSWGAGCAVREKYGVYARVENYVEWIADVIAQD